MNKNENAIRDTIREIEMLSGVVNRYSNLTQNDIKNYIFETSGRLNELLYMLLDKDGGEK